LGRRCVDPSKGAWDLPGGFIDAAETAEEAVAREIKEETGLVVKGTRYVGSFYDTYGKQAEPTLIHCFLVDVDDGDPTPESDVAELRWFRPSEMPVRMAFPHQKQVLRLWLAKFEPGGA
jgi:8-oxo-dGTP diphosphatase